MKPIRRCCLLPLFWLSWAPVWAEDHALMKDQNYRQAANALRDRLPEVAVVKLKRILSGSGIKDADKISAQLLLAEALVRSGQADEARILTESDDLRTLPEARFWHAQAQGRLGEWRGAEADFQAVSKVPDFRYAEEAVFCRAGMLAALGDPERALRILAPLIGKGGQPAFRAELWSTELLLSIGKFQEASETVNSISSPPGDLAASVNYLRGRVALGQGDGKAAEKILAQVTGSASNIPPRLRQAAMLGRVQALWLAGRNPETVSLLKQLLTLTPPPVTQVLAPAFRQLEAMNAPPVADLQALLVMLAASPDPEMRMRARFAQASAMESAKGVAQEVGDGKEISEAEAAWAAIPRDLQAPRDSALLAEALLRQAQYYATSNRRREAISVLRKLQLLSPSPALQAWASWVAGGADYDAGGYGRASREFKAAALQSTDPSVRAAAAYNAAVSGLQAGVSDPSGELEMLDSSPLPEYRMAGPEFHLERSLHMASDGKPGARAGLQAFVDTLPQHPRHFDALIALAELDLRGEPAQPAEAARHLAQARAVSGTDPTKNERADLLEIYVAEATTGPDALAAEAGRFLEKWPLSPKRSDVRMKLAEMYFLRQKFNEARLHFEALAKDDPGGPLWEAAVFWAGKSALSALGTNNTDQAVILWEQVFQKGGPMKWQARLQETLLNQRLRKTAAAEQLVDEILAAGPAVDEVTRWQAMSVRGELLSARDRQPDEIRQGLETFDKLTADPDLPQSWKHQTQVRKGVCLEALARPDEALEVYYDVVSDPPQESLLPTEPVTDDLWFHRAGDKALRLLEDAGKMEEAVEIAKKMAKAPGPRGRAAAVLVDKLSLQNLIYEDAP